MPAANGVSEREGQNLGSRKLGLLTRKGLYFKIQSGQLGFDLLTVIVTVVLILLSLAALLLYFWYIKKKDGRIRGGCCRISPTDHPMNDRLLPD